MKASNTLFEMYKDLHPEFEQRLRKIPPLIADRFIRILSKEKDKLNFLSKISEFLFGEFLDASGCSIAYEKLIKNKTPDWYFEIAGQKAILEVKRINTVEEELRIAEIYELVQSHFKMLPLKLVVLISFDIISAKDFNSTSKFISQVKEYLQKIESFLKDPNQNFYSFLVISLENIPCLRINVKKLEVSTSLKHIAWVQESDSINYDIRRSYGSEIIKKIEKYKEIVRSENVRFYIGLDIVFDTAIKPDEIFEHYVGIGCKDLDTDARSSILGKFYTEDIYQILDGLIIRFQGIFYFIQNPRKNHQLNVYLKTVTQSPT